MASPEFQLMAPDACPVCTPVSALHTGTLMRFLAIVRVSPERYYKIIHNNTTYVTKYSRVKHELDGREHVPNKKERKVIRQHNAKNAKHN